MTILNRRDLIIGALSSGALSSAALSSGLLFDTGRYANVKTFGAVGNGLQDDTLAIYKASRSGRPVYFPAGSYLVTRKIELSSRLIWEGEGTRSTIISDGGLLQVQNGTGSRIRNLNFINRTAPLSLQRNPEDWASARQSRSNSGYQPTINDQDIWERLSEAIRNQDMGPGLRFVGNAEDIALERLTGRLLSILLCDASYSSITDCDFKGGKNFAGGIVLWNIDGQVGRGNVVKRNTVREASFNGIALARNVSATVTDNSCIANGESGIKTWQGDVAGKDASCSLCDISSNTSSYNYYDGFDLGSDVPHSGRKMTRHKVYNNISSYNRMVGFYGDGQGNEFSGNEARFCGNGGLKFRFSNSTISSNRIVSCNQLNFPTDGNQIGIVGENNIIRDNSVVQDKVRSHSYYIAGKNSVSNNYANTQSIGDKLIF